MTATNRPFLGAAGAVQPVDLAAHGYVEKEFLVSGLAGVYDWAAPGTGSSVRLRGARVPYTTRLLLRAPADPRRANGRVVVELLDATAQYEAAPLWGLSWQHFLRRGDIWIGLTVTPDSADTLRRFDRVRYAALSFAGTDSSGCTSGPASAEAGLAWDLIAQVGALLRSSSRENPLVGFDVKHVIAAGYGQAGSDVVTFVNAVHNELRLGNEQPVFDAYLAAAYSDGPASLGGCAGPALTQNPRQPLQPRDVPFVAVMTQADVERAPGLRRADSDAAEDVFRLYEVAGAVAAALSRQANPAASI